MSEVCGPDRFAEIETATLYDIIVGGVMLGMAEHDRAFLQAAADELIRRGPKGRRTPRNLEASQ